MVQIFDGSRETLLGFSSILQILGQQAVQSLQNLSRQLAALERRVHTYSIVALGLASQITVFGIGTWLKSHRPPSIGHEAFIINVLVPCGVHGGRICPV